MRAFKNIPVFLAVALLACGCTQKYLEIDSAKVPQAADFKVKVDVDQETNYVTFTLENKEMVPMWIVGDDADASGKKKYAYTGSGTMLRFRDAGEHSVEVKAYNAHGVSVGSRVVSFTLENTWRNPFDPSKYITMLSGSQSKTWEWNSTVDGHFGCGPNASDPTQWYSANAGDKDGLGLYDDRLTFSADGNFTWNPGEGGTVFVNAGSGYKPEYKEGSDDYQVPAEEFTDTYSFENNWNDAGVEEVYLVLPEGRNLSYIPHMTALNNPRYLVKEQTAKQVTFVMDAPTENGGGGIAWKYQFVVEGSVKPDDPVGPVFDPNSPDNLWLGAVTDDHHFWFADNDWGEIAPGTVTSDGNHHEFLLPEGIGGQQWQGQFFFQNTGIASSSEKIYDFYCVLSATADHAGVTIKLCDMTDDAAIIIDKRYALKAYEDFEVKIIAAEGVDSENLKLVFDFGGGQGGSTVVVKDIIFRESKGEVPPVPDDPTIYDPQSPANMWLSMNVLDMVWFYAPGWTQIDNPELKQDGNSYTVVLPEATAEQWQAQMAFKTDMSSSAGKKYDFYCVLNSSSDHPGVTVKLVLEGDDNTFYFADKHRLSAYEDYVYKVPSMDGSDMDKINLCFDFGGNAAGTEITIKDIIFQEHQE